MADLKPVKVLIAALGGEGGGVLAGWIANAAVASGHVGQRTSIPGVAQRTGATTYYLEVLPQRAGDARPVLALNPAPGEVDLMVASELLESIRAVQAGYVTPDRTVLLASTSRVFTVDEKSAMGDGRVDPERMQEAANRFARRAVFADFGRAAADARCPVSAVLLGAVAASEVLPISADAFRAAIRAEGKAVDANLRGFEAGLALAEAASPQPKASAAPVVPAAGSPANELEATAKKLVPPEAAAITIEAVRRLMDYQGPRYAELYLDRVGRLAKRAGADGAFIRELARHLAVRMSFEDTIRVAQLKLRADRIDRLRREAKARDDDLIEVVEFLKPGPEEIFSLLTPRLGRAVLAFVARRGWSEKSLPMRVRTTGTGGFLRLKALSGLRAWRPRTLRYAEEQAWIERWLSLVERALARDPALAREVIETARLVKGYGETYKRGHANWRRIVDEVIEPLLAERMPKGLLADAVLQCRVAALADPDGNSLTAVIESVRAASAEQRVAAE